MSQDILTRLAASLAHDLNNLFGGIRSLASMAPPESPEEQYADLQSIAKTASEGLMLAEKLQQIARTSSTKQTQFSLSSWLARFAEEFPIELVGDTQILLEADEALLRIALCTLWQYAVDDGALRPRLQVVLEDAHVTLVLQAATMPLQKPRERGRAVGMLLVEQIAETHQGTFSLSTQEGFFSASLHLPRAKRHLVSENTVSSMPRLRGLVLVVHEKAALRRAIAGILQPLGVSLQSVSTLDDALSILLSQDVSVVLLGQHFWLTQEAVVGRFVQQCTAPICVLAQEGLAAPSFPCLSANFGTKDLVEAIGLSGKDV